MRRAVISLILVAAVAYLAVCVVLYLNQRHFVYFPQTGVLETGQPQVEVRSGGVVLRGWALNPGMEEAVIYFGGNAERVEGNVPDFLDLFPDRTVYLLNYRGYGESGGQPTEEGLYRDALAIYDQVAPEHSGITVMGRSLGTGVATYLAVNRRVDRLILVEPFDSMVTVARAAYGLFPVDLLLKDRYDSASRAGEISSQVLVIVAGRDEIIPRASTDSLVAAIPRGLVRTVVIDGATHNDIQDYPACYGAVREFLRQADD